MNVLYIFRRKNISGIDELGLTKVAKHRDGSGIEYESSLPEITAKSWDPYGLYLRYSGDIDNMTDDELDELDIYWVLRKLRGKTSKETKKGKPMMNQFNLKHICT